MPSAEGGPLALAALLTVCIKYTPGFGARRRKLLALLHSVRQQHGLALRVIVATEIERGATLGDAYKSLLAEGSISTFVRLLPGAGLSAGRNALLRRVSTPFVALMDDDLVLHDNRSLPLLVRALMRPDASRVAIAGGCHIDLKRGVRDCFNMRFDVSADGSVVRFRRAQAGERQPSYGMHLRESTHTPPHDSQATSVSTCVPVHATHNFFVGRTAVLQRLGWDPRQRVMEHETFFYQLHLNGLPVLACPDAVALHDTRTSKDDAYEQQSLRATEGLEGRDPGNAYMQYLCKNFPEVRRFETPFTSWRCESHQFCTPLWDAQFAHDGRHCAPFRWNASDDASTVVRPLLDALNRADNHPPARPSQQRARIPLFALVLTEGAHAERRAWQRATWLSFRWHSLSERGSDGTSLLVSDGDDLVPWRYVYIQPDGTRRGGEAYGDISGTGLSEFDPSSKPGAADDIDHGVLAVPYGEVMGDTVTIATSLKGRSGRPLSSLAERAVRWALARIDFEALLVTDDQSMVHIGRVWEWLLRHGSRAINRKLIATHDGVTRMALLASSPPSQIAGSVLLGPRACSQLLRRNSTTVDVVAPPGFHRLKKGRHFNSDGQLSRLARGAMVVDGLRPRPSQRPFDAFRWLMQADGHVAVWQNPTAFSKPDCDGCERSYFPSQS